MKQKINKSMGLFFALNGLELVVLLCLAQLLNILTLSAHEYISAILIFYYILMIIYPEQTNLTTNDFII